MGYDFATLYALRGEILFEEETLRSKVLNDKSDPIILAKASALAWAAERITYAIEANLESINEERRERSNKTEKV
ncbi:hypothetical protein H1S01_18690 [Heliobacterium chlorum]|uniref:Uncharacterized protein n=1 Tax=Heliobacterium chlorum TaxID=2698 RepID=A0ABR7T8T1_HELCL|nr:hypothetical protein [Heliobacterium chlorum]MBC9786488.1 hypothetical protein [Heliobacterium chlorum]